MDNKVRGRPRSSYIPPVAKVVMMADPAPSSETPHVYNVYDGTESISIPFMNVVRIQLGSLDKPEETLGLQLSHPTDNEGNVLW